MAVIMKGVNIVKRAWLYCRLSPMVEAEYQEAMRQQLRDYALSHSYEIVGESCDICDKIALDREGFKAGLDALAAMKADIILIPRISSVFRDVSTAIEICKDIGVLQDKIVPADDEGGENLRICLSMAKLAHALC